MIHIKENRLRSLMQIWLLIFPMIKPSVDAVGFFLNSRIAHNINMFLWAWNFFSVLLIVAILAMRVVKNKHKIFPCVWLSMGLVVSFFIGSLSTGSFNAGTPRLIDFVQSVGNPMFFIILADIYAQKDFDYFIEAVYRYLMVLSLITSITIYIYYPNMYGMESYYLFGLDNVSFLYAMNSFIAGIIYRVRIKKKIGFSFVALYIIIFGAYIYCKTGAGTVCSMLLLACCILFSRRTIKFISLRKIMVITLCGMLFVIFTQSFLPFSRLLSLLGKNTSLSGRTIIWASALRMFPKHSVFGLGVSASLFNNTIMAGGMVAWGRGGLGHMHNVLLEILIKGGVVGFILFILQFILIFRLLRHRESSAVSQHLCYLFPIFALAYSFEYRLDDISFWIMVVILSYGIPKDTTEKKVSEVAF